MLSDINKYKEDEVFESELCIIGGGAAGIDMARFFDKKNKSVLVIESGGIEFEQNTQKLYEMKCIGKSIRDGEYNFRPCLSEALKGECRVRMFGGTTNIWSGKWKMLEPIDFERKEWIPNSGWPISYEDLLPYYKEIAQEYGILDLNSRLYKDLQTERIDSVLSKTSDIKYTIHYTQRPPLNFNTNLYKEEMIKSQNLSILLHANAYELILDDSLKVLEKLVVKTLEKKEYTIISEVFILACGGLENARLLLSSNKQIPAGIGNTRNLVGRFYMDHPKGKFGIVKPSNSYSASKILLDSHKKLKSYRIGLSLSEHKQKELKVLNHNFYLTPVYKEQRFELLIFTLEMLKLAISEFSVSQFISEIKILLKNFTCFIRMMARKLLNKPIISYYEMTHYLEQSPNPESKLFLSEETDALGMRKLVIDWNLSSLDKESFERFIKQMQKVFYDTGLGDLFTNKNYNDLKFVGDASHHMGTTRMGNNIEDGVVDRNCKVFGIDNLYIAGSSIFPTSGNANPTYTILALSRKLCHHLIRS